MTIDPAAIAAKARKLIEMREKRDSFPVGSADHLHACMDYERDIDALEADVLALCEENLEGRVRLNRETRRREVAEKKVDVLRDTLYQLLGTTLTGAALRKRIERLLSDTQVDPLSDSVELAIEKGTP